MLLCAAMELDTGIGALCARAQREPSRPYPTFALALTLFADPAWDALSPERPLRYWRLIEINQPDAQPLTTSPLRADERIVNYLKGVNYLDDRLAALLTPVEIPGPAIDLPLSQQSSVNSILRRLRQTAGDQSVPVIQLLGPDGSSKQLIASHAAHALGLRAYRLPVALLPGQAGEIENPGAALAARESADANRPLPGRQRHGRRCRPWRLRSQPLAGAAAWGCVPRHLQRLAGPPESPACQSRSPNQLPPSSKRPG